MTNRKKLNLLLVLTMAALTIFIFNIPKVSANNDISNDKGLLLDVARHPMSKDDIIKVIYAASDSGFDYIDLHLSDNQNCSFIPNFANGKTDYRFQLSNQDLSEIVEVAKSKDLYIVPDVDMPSHAGALLKILKENNSELAKKIIMDGTDDTINYNDDDAIMFINAIYNQIADIFSSQDTRYLSIGLDEVAGESTQLASYVNKINKYQNNNGFQLIVWNDSLLKKEISELDQNVIINYWSQYGDQTDYIERSNNRISVSDVLSSNHQIINSNQENYYKIENIGNPSNEDAFIEQFNRYFKPNYFDEVVNKQKNHYTIENSNNSGSGYLISLWGENSSNITTEQIILFINKLSQIN